MKPIRTCVLAISMVVGSASGARAEPAALGAPLDYGNAANWVCRSGPGLSCGDDLSATVLPPNGSATLEIFRAAKAPQADCFYVYPTVSTTAALNAAPMVTDAERRAVRQQAERFTSICRLFAPFYRQITVTSMLPGFPKPTEAQYKAASDLANRDILAAWDEYMSNDNHGRPFILIGHSQGASLVIQLLKERIDGRPTARNLVSAVIPGIGVVVPKGKSVGGTFRNIPPCRAETQTGCVIAFNTVRADRALPPEMKAPSDGTEMVCTNPASLPGGSGFLKPYLSSAGETIIPALTSAQHAWTTTNTAIPSPFVALPGLYTAECREDQHGALLAIKLHKSPGDRRTGAITGDWVMNGRIEPTMGLHLIDLNLTAGNLVDVLRAQIGAMRQNQAGDFRPQN